MACPYTRRHVERQDDLIFNILAAFAEFERETIGARIADARSRLKAKGRRIGGAAPYGYDADPITKQLTANADEAEAVKWMFEVAACGMHPAAIAESANSRGWRTKIMWPDKQRSGGGQSVDGAPGSGDPQQSGLHRPLE